MPSTADSELLSRATQIGDHLLANAQTAEDGSPTWGRGYGRAFGPVVDAGLFNGRQGEAYFLAALAHATGEERFSTAARAIVARMRSLIVTAEGMDALLEEIGYGLTGVGAVLYAQVRMSAWLGEPDLLADAATAVQTVSDDQIRKDLKYEIFWGTSGLLLGFLALHRAGVAGALGKARTCGDHLLDARVTDQPSGKRAWPTMGKFPSTGFAHGSSGIAHSLVELHLDTKDDRYYDAAIETFGYEQSVYREAEENWPDTLDQDKAAMVSWCHGAAGVGLSRLSVINTMHDSHHEAIVSDLYRALRRVNAASDHGPDNLCCGNFGRADFLFEAGRRLGNASLEAAGKERVVRRLEATEGIDFRHPSWDDPHMRAGMWQGLAGIGYQLIRVTNPERFPSVTLLA